MNTVRLTITRREAERLRDVLSHPTPLGLSGVKRVLDRQLAPQLPVVIAGQTKIDDFLEEE